MNKILIENEKTHRSRDRARSIVRISEARYGARAEDEKRIGSPKMKMLWAKERDGKLVYKKRGLAEVIGLVWSSDHVMEVMLLRKLLQAFPFWVGWNQLLQGRRPTWKSNIGQWRSSLPPENICPFFNREKRESTRHKSRICIQYWDCFFEGPVFRTV